MLVRPDIRYQGTGPQTARTDRLLWPVRVHVTRPTGEQALGDVRRVVEQLRQAAEQAHLPGARLAVLDLASAWGQYAAALTLNQTSKKEVKLELLFFVLLTAEADPDFWGRAAVISRMADFLQRFCQAPREK